jgi:hypothetical protein
MKKLVLSFVLFSVVAAQAQTVVSKVLYTLKDKEKVEFNDEHNLSLKNTPNGSILFTSRATDNGDRYFAIVNGVEYGPYLNIDNPEILLFSTSGHFYFVCAKDTSKLWVNVDGKEYGPYDELNPKGNSAYHLFQDSVGNFGFAFRRGDAWGVLVNGKEYKAYSPSDYRFNNMDIKLNTDGTFSFASKDKDKMVMNINGTESVSEGEIMESAIFDKTNTASLYKKGDKTCLNFNGKEECFDEAGYREFGPYGFCVTYKDGDKFYSNVNGKKAGPYESTSNYFGAKYPLKDCYYFGYQKADKWYVNYCGKEIGPFETNYANINISPGAKLMSLWYKKGEKKFIKFSKDKANTFHNEIGPFDDMNYETGLKDDGSFYFTYVNNGKRYVVINGKINGPYFDVSDLNYIDKTHYSYTIDEGKNTKIIVNEQETVTHQEGVKSTIINGKKYGPYTEVLSVFNDGTKIGICYKKGEAYYLMMNNKETGPFKYASLSSTAKPAYAFYETEKGNHYIFNNIDFEIPATGWECYTTYSDDFKHLLISIPSKNYMSIDGKKFDNNVGFGYQYNKAKKCYTWLSLKDNSIIVNEYNVD